MTMIISWLEIYWREVLFGLFWALQGLFLILMIITLHRASVVKKKLNRVVDGLETCLQAALKADKPEVQTQTVSRRYQAQTERDEKAVEEENRIISTMLKEIFP